VQLQLIQIGRRLYHSNTDLPDRVSRSAWMGGGETTATASFNSTHTSLPTGVRAQLDVGVSFESGCTDNMLAMVCSLSPVPSSVPLSFANAT
jgi:hypothetical protein